MRVIIILILLAIVGAGVYIGIFHRDWFMQQAEETVQTIKGYTPAKTPQEAMEKFEKAIKERDYKAAAKYVSADYAKLLKKGHDAGVALGQKIDKLNNLCQQKGIYTDQSKILLLQLDPFPRNFKWNGEIETKKEDDEKVFFSKYEPDPPVDPSEMVPAHLTIAASLDKGMFQNALMPSMVKNVPAFDATVVLVSEGSGEDKQWKLDVPEPYVKALREEVDHFLKNYKKYERVLDDFIERMPKAGAFSDDEAFEKDLIQELKTLNKN